MAHTAKAVTTFTTSIAHDVLHHIPHHTVVLDEQDTRDKEIYVKTRIALSRAHTSTNAVMSHRVPPLF